MAFRRERKRDYFVRRSEIRSTLAEIRDTIPGCKSLKNDELVSLLGAALTYEKRRRSGDLDKGVKSKWGEELLTIIPSSVKAILGRGTFSVTVGFSSFVAHYLPILKFPQDVVEALEGGDISLFEAEQLIRLNAKNLGLSEESRADQKIADKLRHRVMVSHFKSINSTTTALREKVNIILAEWKSRKGFATTTELVGADDGTLRGYGDDVDVEEVLKEIDYDHLLYEVTLTFADMLKRINVEVWDEKDIERVLSTAKSKFFYK